MVKHTLRLVSHGKWVKLHVVFDSKAHVGDFCRLHADVVKAEIAMKNDKTTEACDAYGKAIMSLYRLVLGDAATRAIDAWFAEDVLQMVSQINPFIRDRIIPDVEKHSA